MDYRLAARLQYEEYISVMAEDIPGRGIGGDVLDKWPTDFPYTLKDHFPCGDYTTCNLPSFKAIQDYLQDPEGFLDDLVSIQHKNFPMPTCSNPNAFSWSEQRDDDDPNAPGNKSLSMRHL